jgi:hypothetical protein
MSSVIGQGLQLGGDGEKLLPVPTDRIKPPFVVQSALVCRAGPAKLWHHLIRSSAEGGGEACMKCRRSASVSTTSFD